MHTQMDIWCEKWMNVNWSNPHLLQTFHTCCHLFYHPKTSFVQIISWSKGFLRAKQIAGKSWPQQFEVAGRLKWLRRTDWFGQNESNEHPARRARFRNWLGMFKARADLFPRKLVSKDCHKPEGAGHIGRTCLSKNSARSESFIETETIGVLWETYTICFSHSKPNSRGRTMQNATSTKAAIKYIQLWGLRLEARCSKHRPLRLAWYN